jgi:hypothetical protein
MWEAFGVRALMFALDRGADFGECMTTVGRVPDGDVDGWHREWVATGDRIAAIGDASAAAGYPVSARGVLPRLQLLSCLLSPALRRADRSPAGRRLRSGDGDISEGCRVERHPHRGGRDSLRGDHSARVLRHRGRFRRPRPTIVHTNGYDSTIQEMYFAHAPAAIRRGYNVLLYDGPGQGRNLIKDGIHIRPDWENVVRPVIDYALTRPEIDRDRIVLAGWSFGGFLAPRVASFEHRIAALVADPGQWDEREAFLRALPLTDEQKAAFPNIDPALLDPFDAWLNGPDAPPMLHWVFIQRGLWANGVDNLYDYIVDMPRYEFSPVAKNIACPTFVAQAMDDPIADFAPKLYEAITQPKVLVPFTAAEGASMHTEALARTLYEQRMFDWLDQTLGVRA